MHNISPARLQQRPTDVTVSDQSLSTTRSSTPSTPSTSSTLSTGEQVSTRALHDEDWNPPKPATAPLVHQLLNELILPKMLPGAKMSFSTNWVEALVALGLAGRWSKREKRPPKAF